MNENIFYWSFSFSCWTPSIADALSLRVTFQPSESFILLFPPFFKAVFPNLSTLPFFQTYASLPLFSLQSEFPDHDIIYCSKQCYFDSEFQKKTEPPAAQTSNSSPLSSPKKKWKTSLVYKLQNNRIDIATLLDQCPELESATATSSRRSSASVFAPSGVDCDKTTAGGVDGNGKGGSPREGKGKGKGRGRGRRKCLSSSTGESCDDGTCVCLLMFNGDDLLVLVSDISKITY